MPTRDQILEGIAIALAVEKVTESDSSTSVPKWDSLGHLLIQIELSKLTDGKSDGIDGLASARSIADIFSVLEANGLFSDG